MIVYRLKFQDAETFLAAAGPQLGIAQGTTNNADATLNITSEPLGERLFVSGTAKMLEKFQQVAELVDSDPNLDPEVLEIDPPYLHTYPVLVDPKVAFSVLQTMLESSNARMAQDEDSGAITVLGNKDVHNLVQSTLDTLSGKVGEGFAMIKVTQIDAADALGILQTIFGQDSLSSEEGGSKGPVLLADSYLGQIIVKGTVQQVAQVKAMVKTLDENAEPGVTGPRSGTVLIPMDESDKDRLEPMIPDLLKMANRDENPFQVIRPQDRKNFDRKMRGDALDQMEELMRENGLIDPDESTPDTESRDRRAVPNGRRKADFGWQSPLNHASALVALAAGPSLQCASILLQEEETGSDKKSPNPDYLPPPQKKSVPGAPIQFRFTDYGLTIESDDLDAVEDMESAIRSFLGEASAPQKPTFFYLKHRGVEEVKLLLEEVFGLVESGGGGGGGLMGGMMNNMMGGAGDLLGGLLDSGLDEGSASMVLEGDVTFTMDVRFNALLVSGATGNDLSSINQLIEIFDQPQGPVDPDLQGEFRTIDVVHREATDLVERVREQLPELIYDPNQKSGQAGNAEMANALKAMQALAGGKGGGNSADVEKQKAKAVLGVDELTNRVLVTGPDHIYEKIYKVVVELDIPDLSEPKASETLPSLTGGRATLRVLQKKFGALIEVEEAEEGEGESPSNSKNSRPSGAQPGDNNAARNAMINAMRQQMQRAQQSQRASGGRGGGAGGRGGGAGGRGGGRGGR